MRILGACIFSKFFGGKIIIRCYLQSFKNLEYACSKYPYFFFKLLTANLRNFVNIYVSTEVRSEQEKSFLEIRRHDLCLKFDFSGDCSKNLISTSALSLSFDLKEHHTEVSAQLILISSNLQEQKNKQSINVSNRTRFTFQSHSTGFRRV